jgi:3,4-dihydroxy 2-butanone 4-phosphate synthase/GTP cyclohydrolase II
VLRDVFAASGGVSEPAAGRPLRMIEEAGKGVLLYVFPRGRASLLAELDARSAAATPGEAAALADSRLRNFGLGAQVLAHLGVGRIRLLTNQPRRVVGVAGYGLEIVECLPIGAPAKVVRLREQEG